MVNPVDEIWNVLNGPEYRLIFQVSFYIIIPIGLASAVLAIILILKTSENTK